MKRDGEGEGRASGGAVDPDAAAVEFDEGLGEGEAEAEAAEAFPVAFEAVVGLEESLLFLLADAGACVVDLDNEVRVVMSGAEGDPPALGGILEGVIEEVEDDLAEPGPVGLDRRERWWQGGRKLG